MKKYIQCLIASVLAISLMGSPAMAAAKKKLTWWVGTDAIWKIIAERFEKANPNVDVVILTGDVDKFYTMITAGLMPDIWGPWNTPGIQADVNRNWALDLSPYLKRDGKSMKIDDFFPGVMRQFKVSGKQYSIPAFLNIDEFFINTTLWAQAGLQLPPLDSKDKSWSWDRMVECAMKTTKRNANGRVSQAGINLSMEWFNIPSWFHIWGAEPYSKETFKTSVPQKIHLNTPETVTALTKVWELRYKYNVFGTGFPEGRCGATMQNGYVVYDIVKAKKLKWAVRNLPWGKTNSGTLWPNGWRIAKVTKDKELAWKFMKFLCSPEILRLAGTDPKSHLQFTAPVRASVFKETLGKNIGNATGMDPDDVYRVAAQADNVGVVKYQETVCLHVDMDKFLNPELQKMWENKVSPKECAANLQAASDRRLPELFKRWMRNIKFTGADKNYDSDALPTTKSGLM